MNITKEMMEKELEGLMILKNKLADAYNKNLGAIEALGKVLVSISAPEPKIKDKAKKNLN